MPYQEKAEAGGLAAAALVFAIISVVTAWIPFAGFPCAVLSFVFALLSRGGKKMSTMAAVAVVIALIGLIVGVVLFLGVWTFFLRSLGVFGPDQMLRLFNGILRMGLSGGAYVC